MDVVLCWPVITMIVLLALGSGVAIGLYCYQPWTRQLRSTRYRRYQVQEDHEDMNPELSDMKRHQAQVQQDGYECAQTDYEEVMDLGYDPVYVSWTPAGKTVHLGQCGPMQNATHVQRRLLCQACQQNYMKHGSNKAGINKGLGKGHMMKRVTKVPSSDS